jgi:hypothetical protein
MRVLYFYFLLVNFFFEYMTSDLENVETEDMKNLEESLQTLLDFSTPLSYFPLDF